MTSLYSLLKLARNTLDWKAEKSHYDFRQPESYKAKRQSTNICHTTNQL
jgi:hypothetical protein